MSLLVTLLLTAAAPAAAAPTAAAPAAAAPAAAAVPPAPAAAADPAGIAVSESGVHVADGPGPVTAPGMGINEQGVPTKIRDKKKAVADSGGGADCDDKVSTAPGGNCPAAPAVDAMAINEKGTSGTVKKPKPNN